MIDITWKPKAGKGLYPHLSEEDVAILESRQSRLPSLRQYYQEYLPPGKKAGEQAMYAVMMDASDMIKQYSMPLPHITKPNRRHRTRRWEEGKGDNSGWFGFTLEQTEHHIRYGWKEGGQQVRKLMDKLKIGIEPVCARLKTRFGQDGDEVSIDHFLDSQYDRMWRYAHRESGIGPRVLQVSFNWGGNCGLSSEQLFWSGAVAAILVDQLEQSGYAVELRAWCTGVHWEDRGRAYNLLGVTVKESDQMMSLDLLAALSAHSGAFRHHGIQAIELAPFNVGTGHGMHMEVCKPLLEVLSRDTSWFEPPALVVESVYDEHAAQESLNNLITIINERKDLNALAA